MSSGLSQHWHHWKHVDVKHLFKFKWKLKVYGPLLCRVKPECVCLIHDGKNMWLLRIIKPDFFSCAIPELQCLHHNSTAWTLAGENKFSLYLEERRKDSCLHYLNYIALIFRITKSRKIILAVILLLKDKMLEVGISLNSPLRMAVTVWWGIQAQALSNEDFNLHGCSGHEPEKRKRKPTCICQNGVQLI